MARGDNRKSRKMIQRRGQVKKKARLARRAAATKATRQSRPATSKTKVRAGA